MPDDSHDDIVRSRKRAAELLGVTPPALKQWAEDPSFPEDGVQRGTTGRLSNWNVRVIREWRDTVGRKGSELTDQALAVRLRRDSAEAAIKEAHLRDVERIEQQKLGNLLSRDEYEVALLEVIGKARDLLLTLPGRLSKLPSVKNRRAHKAEADAEIRKVLTIMADDIELIEQRVDP